MAYINILIIVQSTILLASHHLILVLDIFHLHLWILHMGIKEELGRILKGTPSGPKFLLRISGRSIYKYRRHYKNHRKNIRLGLINIEHKSRSRWERKYGYNWTRRCYKVMIRKLRLYDLVTFEMLENVEDNTYKLILPPYMHIYKIMINIFLNFEHELLQKKIFTKCLNYILIEFNFH